MEKDINTEWDAIAKYKEKVCFPFIKLMQEMFFVPIPSDKVVHESSSLNKGALS